MLLNIDMDNNVRTKTENNDKINIFFGNAAEYSHE